MSVEINILINITSIVVLLCVVAVSYFYLKRKQTLTATEAFKYLNIKLVENEDHCDEIVSEFLKKCSKHHAIGFDCEWVTVLGKRQPVALIQLSTYDGFCSLFRLSKMNSIPASLKNLLEDEKIYKVGVAPVDDAKYVAADYGVYIKSTLDIRHIVELCGYDPGGLAALSLSLLGVTLDKTWRIRCSDWAATELTTRQINYAAADAHVAIKMFVNLVNKHQRRGLLWFRGKDHWDNLNELCWKYADVCFKTKVTKKVKNGLKDKESKPSKDLVLSKRYPYAIRSKPLYHNCFLQAPDGELLCTCDTKKAIWYVEKELADKVSDDPLTVRLRFEPAGRSVGTVGQYYQLTKQNRCVVCGEDNSYIRKNVVPREYRKHFPEVMKDHSSHDVLLLCVACHQRSNMLDQAVRERLALLCDAPFASHDKTKYIEDAECKKIRSAARALLYQSRKHVLPEARVKELETVLLLHYPEHDEITEQLLAEASEISVVIENADYECHGYKVVEYFLNNEVGGLLRLEEMWRQHFLDCMQPRHMPHLWSVKHNEERLRVRLSEGRLSENDMKMIGMPL
ncbi:exonuclease 3'-5' domain-containing protein 2 [Zerene cesonia]|uniref:exonuclease 3'-5' domain-containing protein 2 n=1 Tax=Zerene cesonia TaxID=33412 RepID=UPI0018E5507D|nr:exonuclease 3'-5' domain-containing protein 2 [Zerene cesonia]